MGKRHKVLEMEYIIRIRGFLFDKRSFRLAFTYVSYERKKETLKNEMTEVYFPNVVVFLGFDSFWKKSTETYLFQTNTALGIWKWEDLKTRSDTMRSTGKLLANKRRLRINIERDRFFIHGLAFNIRCYHQLCEDLRTSKCS